MHILLINGSPHEKGCTYTALAEVEKALHAGGIGTRWFHLGSRPVRGCVACGGCRKAGKCVFDDDGCNQLSAMIREADGVVIGSPVYYAGPNGALCALLDRVFYSSGGRFDGKPGAAVVSCRRGGASAAFDRLNKYFTICNMPVIPSQYWNSIHGNTPQEAAQDLEGLQIMRTLGNNMAVFLRRKEAAGLPEAEREQRVNTNFIR